MSRLSASTYVEFHQATNHTFEPYMPIVVNGAILGGVVLADSLPAFIRGRSAGSRRSNLLCRRHSHYTPDQLANQQPHCSLVD